MNHEIIIVSEEHRQRAMLMVELLPLDPVHKVTIQEFKRNRSGEQNSMYWKWLTIIGAELGETKEDIHERYKDKFLVNIYERDKPEYADMIQSLRAVWQSGMKKEAIDLKKKIVALTSTTTATVKQMTEYMENVERDAAGMAISLPHPEDNS